MWISQKKFVCVFPEKKSLQSFYHSEELSERKHMQKQRSISEYKLLFKPIIYKAKVSAEGLTDHTHLSNLPQ